MCEYCKENMESKPLSDKYEVIAIETLVSERNIYNYCDCGRHSVIEINYCPMCGKKLGV
jgi:hypothetical protein